jgi:hypothetical protein
VKRRPGVDGVFADGVAVGVGAGHAIFGVDGDEVRAPGGDQVGELPQGGAGSAKGLAYSRRVGALSAGLDGPAAGAQSGCFDLRLLDLHRRRQLGGRAHLVRPVHRVQDQGVLLDPQQPEALAAAERELRHGDLRAALQGLAQEFVGLG